MACRRSVNSRSCYVCFAPQKSGHQIVGAGTFPKCDKLSDLLDLDFLADRCRRVMRHTPMQTEAATKANYTVKNIEVVAKGADIQALRG